ncbi:MAG: 3-dehydroquinate synthase, partial [Xanthomonadales bacterium]|nr:3-dehydroquinate synthase [Xanthomonadales bacterium]NIX12244.1 3-dehydroquinate synthase [Xanthomonadales bacterium]
LWERFATAGKGLVVSNDVVAPLYLDRVMDVLPSRCRNSLVLPDGEHLKNVESWKS